MNTNTRNRPRGFTLTEMLVVVVVLVFLLVLLVPWLSESESRGRRVTCINNLKQLGLAFHNFHDAHRKLPAASGVTRDEDGAITAVDGWSYVVTLLPYMEYGAVCDTLDMKTGRPLVEPAGRDGTPHADARRTVLSELICSSYKGSLYADPATKADAITNYKVMGATHHESLSVASAEPAVPKYDPEGAHPDGACFPGTQLKFASFTRDGTAHTILGAETIEREFARWTVSADAAVVGLPRAVEYGRYEGRYYAPRGFDGTYLDWDYGEHPYDGTDGT